jgi:hypothetical protein
VLFCLYHLQYFKTEIDIIIGTMYMYVRQSDMILSTFHRKVTYFIEWPYFVHASKNIFWVIHPAGQVSFKIQCAISNIFLIFFHGILLNSTHNVLVDEWTFRSLLLPWESFWSEKKIANGLTSYILYILLVNLFIYFTFPIIQFTLNW